MSCNDLYDVIYIYISTSAEVKSHFRKRPLLFQEADAGLTVLRTRTAMASSGWVS